MATDQQTALAFRRDSNGLYTNKNDLSINRFNSDDLWRDTILDLDVDISYSRLYFHCYSHGNTINVF